MRVSLAADVIETAAGWIGLGYSERGLCRLSFPSPTREQALGAIGSPGRSAGSGELPELLQAYFSGVPTAFRVPLDLSGGTPFQQQVWQILLTIPYGVVRSYVWLAEALGRPGAARAVGAAVGANPLPIVIPCHRIIGADGGLCGYAGGLELKQYLLQLEGVSSQR